VTFSTTNFSAETGCHPRLRGGTRPGWQVGSVEDANIAFAEVCGERGDRLCGSAG